MEEVEALQAIYCSPGEFEILYSKDNDGIIFKVRLSYPERDVVTQCVELKVEVPSSYPSVVPNIFITETTLSKEAKRKLQSDVKTYAKQKCSNEILMDIIMWVQNHIHLYHTTVPDGRKETCPEVSDLWLSVLHLDHMRAKTKYIKTLKNWANDLNVIGCILFCEAWIFELLQGRKQDIKDFITQQRTVCIDVDSSGRSCKERMLKMLYECQYKKSFSDFSVIELKSMSELEEYFDTSDLLPIFKDHIKPIVKRH